MINFPIPTAVGEQFEDPASGNSWEWDGIGWIGSGGSSVLPATLAEAAAGTINTAYLSPQTGVPKDAAGMTGAGILPAGDDLQRPGAPVGGMVRYSTLINRVEYYDVPTGVWYPIGEGGNTVKAFVNIGITPQGVVTVLSSYNVASVVHTGQFYYDINFAVPMKDTAYAVLGSAVSTGVISLVQGDPGPAPTSTTKHQVRTYYPLSTTPGTALTGAPVWTFSASWLFLAYP